MGEWYNYLFLLDDGVIVTDVNHRIVDVNASYEHFSGYSRDFLIGKGAGFIKSGLTPPDVYRSLKQALAEERSWRGILTNKRPSGQLWNSSVTITRLHVDGQVFYVGVCRDVQEIVAHDIYEAYESLFSIIAQLSESSDPSIQSHLSKVSWLVDKICRGLGLDEERILWIRTASLLHDVGKMVVPREVLFKPGPLSEAERKLIQTHAVVGRELLHRLSESMAKIYGYNEALVIAMEVANGHHERYDGGGYPLGLEREDIPLSARIVTVADVVDALLSVRPYKAAWHRDVVRQYLWEEAGKQFDPKIVDAVLSDWVDIVSMYESSSGQGR